MFGITTSNFLDNIFGFCVIDCVISTFRQLLAIAAENIMKWKMTSCLWHVPFSAKMLLSAGFLVTFPVAWTLKTRNFDILLISSVPFCDVSVRQIPDTLVSPPWWFDMELSPLIQISQILTIMNVWYMFPIQTHHGMRFILVTSCSYHQSLVLKMQRNTVEKKEDIWPPLQLKKNILLLHEYRDLFIDMAMRNNRSKLAIANRHQER